VKGGERIFSPPFTSGIKTDNNKLLNDCLTDICRIIYLNLEPEIVKNGDRDIVENINKGMRVMHIVVYNIHF
jgi:hypothetical protein